MIPLIGIGTGLGVAKKGIARFMLVSLFDSMFVFMVWIRFGSHFGFILGGHFWSLRKRPDPTKVM